MIVSRRLNVFLSGHALIPPDAKISASHSIIELTGFLKVTLSFGEIGFDAFRLEIGKPKFITGLTMIKRAGFFIGFDAKFRCSGFIGCFAFLEKVFSRLRECGRGKSEHGYRGN